MSDDLAKSWNGYVASMGCVMGEVEHMAQQMADRIKELEAKLTKALEALCAVETATATADGMTPDETISLHAIVSEKIEELKEKTNE